MFLKCSYIISRNQFDIIILFNFSSFSLHSKKSSTSGKVRSIELLRLLFAKFINLNFPSFSKEHIPPVEPFQRPTATLRGFICVSLLWPFQDLFLRFPGSGPISWETFLPEKHKASSEVLAETHPHPSSPDFLLAYIFILV